MVRISMTIEEIDDLIDVLESHDFCSDWLVEHGIPFIDRFKKAKERHYKHSSGGHRWAQERYMVREGQKEHLRLTKLYREWDKKNNSKKEGSNESAY